jgi:hypothetical protein
VDHDSSELAAAQISCLLTRAFCDHNSSEHGSGIAHPSSPEHSVITTAASLHGSAGIAHPSYQSIL